MVPRNFLRDYVSRLTHQTLVQVTGGLGFFLTAILELVLPGVIIKWIFYLILLAAGLIVGSYQVFIDLIKEHATERDNLAQQIEALKLKIREIEEKRPRIAVRLLNNNDEPTQRIQFFLRPLQPIPSPEEAIAKKRDELRAKKQNNQIESESGLKIIFRGPEKLNPNYDQEVEEYLKEYRKYLVEMYEHSISKDRIRGAALIVENQGLYPATDITIELTMPADYRSLSKEQLLGWNMATIGMDYTPSPPKEPSFSLSLVDQHLVGSDWLLSPISENRYRDPEPSNTSGPSITSKDGVSLIIYHINKLIQNRPEHDFAPMLFWLGNVNKSTTWEIMVKVYSAELSVPLKDILWIDLKVQDEDP